MRKALIWIIARRKGSPVSLECDGYVVNTGELLQRPLSGFDMFYPPSCAMIFDHGSSADSFLREHEFPGFDMSVMEAV